MDGEEEKKERRLIEGNSTPCATILLKKQTKNVMKGVRILKE